MHIYIGHFTGDIHVVKAWVYGYTVDSPSLKINFWDQISDRHLLIELTIVSEIRLSVALVW